MCLCRRTRMQGAPGLRVAIVGAGPAGAALATLLTQDGHDVVLFDDGRRPELVVGESLIPAGIPPLRRLGIEDAVAAIGMAKPGATLTWSPTHRFAFRFERYRRWMVPYAYNVPRHAFDQVLLDRAVAVGARRVTMRASFARGARAGGRDAAELVARRRCRRVDRVARARPRRRRHGPRARLGAPARDPGHDRSAERRRPLRALRELRVERGAGTGVDRPARRRVELADSAERAPLARRRAEPARRGRARRHARRPSRRGDRVPRRPRRDRAGRAPGDRRRDLQQLPADLDPRHRARLGRRR